LINDEAPTSVGDTLGDNGALAFRFESPSSPASLGWIAPACAKINSGCDVYVALETDEGSGPTGVVLAACYIPAEWLSTTFPAAIPAWGFPLAYDMTASTFYNIVFYPAGSPLAPGPAPSLAAGINDFQLMESTDGSGAYTFDGTNWNPQSYGYAINLWSTAQTTDASTQSLVNVVEDSGGNTFEFPAPTLHKNYQYNDDNLIAFTQEWAAKAPSGPFNMLCRDDASFNISGLTGTYDNIGSPVNATLATVSSPLLVGAYSLKMTAVSSASAMSMSTLVLNNSTGLNQYIPVNYSSSYSAIVAVAPGTTLQHVRIDISWYTGATTPAFISTTEGVEVTELAVGWTYAFNVNAISPINAAIAQVTVNILGTLAADEVHYVGVVGMFANSNTIWSPPGVGISSSRTLSYNAANAPVYVL
jgi:hypothetical protein